MRYPKLLTNTTVDWFFAWSEETLYAISKAVLTPDNHLIPSACYASLIEHMVHVHLSAEEYSREFVTKSRKCNFVTSKHFLDYINNYMRCVVGHF